MKNTILLICALITGIHALIAQSPARMSFQAVVRNNTDALVKNQAVGVRSSILHGSSTGSVIYQEIFNPNPITNQNGLLTFEVGGGLAITGNFGTINWANGPFFVRTEIDPNGGTNYSINATSQLLSVPYALFAKNVENVPSLKMNDLSDVNSSSAQTGQTLKWDGSNWVPGNDNTGGGSGPTYSAGTGININASNVISNTGDNDNSATNELQTLSLSGTQLSLSNGGGTVTLPTSGGGGGDDWGSQIVVNDGLSMAGNGTPASPIKINDQGVRLEHLSEIGATSGETFIYNGSNWETKEPVSIVGSNGIQAVKSPGAPLTYVLTADDESATNEIQALSLNVDKINLSKGGGSVTLPDPSSTNELQTVSVSSNGTLLTIINPNGTPQGASVQVSQWQKIGSDIVNANAGQVQVENLFFNGTTITTNGSNPQLFFSAPVMAVDPNSNNLVGCGSSSFKWGAVWAAVGTIQTSDETVKKNIQPMHYGLDQVMQLKPVSWQWKDERIPYGTSLGFLAQDMEKIVPEIVVKPTAADFEECARRKKENGAEGQPTMGMKYAELIPVLTKAIQEQQAMIEELNAKIKKLESK